MRAYFIDDNIWFQGVKQEPRKVYCYNLVTKNGMAYFNDKDGDTYVLPVERIFVEKGETEDEQTNN